ncbi:MAG TPA: OB-fold domain-containing protein [Rhizobiaceae bacterium]|nr:OB-fold domain-containing protein [Rhizobiaceae bacterium]
MTMQKPLPQITPLDREYWEHARNHRLHIQRCKDCDTYRYPASPVCAQCGGPNWAYSPVSGRGEVVSWVVFHRCYFPSFQAEIPYNVAGVRLDEGVMMMSNILAPNDSLHHGMKVEVVFEDVTPDISIPKFRPVQEDNA